MSGEASLSMVRFRPDKARLIAFAHARKSLPRSGDLGYAIHQALTALFGAAAPKPFQILEGPNFELLAYGSHDGDALTEYAALQSASSPQFEEAKAILGFDPQDVKRLPEVWGVGRKYDFEVRTRPVSRTSRASERGLPHERDIFLNALAQLPPDENIRLDRQRVYLDWFKKQVEGEKHPNAANLAALRIAALKRTRVHRKGAPNLEGPDVTFTGTLQVAKSDDFARLLARGIGRHRAFGFGMILLKPAAA